MRLCDGGGLCNETVAIITVSTNNFPPVLQSNNYQRTIPETWALGETVFDVNATDADIAVSNLMCTMCGWGLLIFVVVKTRNVKVKRLHLFSDLTFAL